MTERYVDGSAFCVKIERDRILGIKSYKKSPRMFLSPLEAPCKLLLHIYTIYMLGTADLRSMVHISVISTNIVMAV